MSKIVIFISSLMFALNVSADGVSIKGGAAEVRDGAPAAQLPNVSFLKAAEQSCKTNPISCILMGLTAAQIIQTLGAGNAAASTAAQVDAGNFGAPGGPAGPGTSDPSANAGPTLSQLNGDLAMLSKKGININPTTGDVTMPSGSTYPSSAFASGATMAAAGIVSKDEIGKVDGLIKSVMDKAKVVSMGIANSGGGGGGSSGSVTKSTYEDNYQPFRMPREKIDKVKTAGLTRKLASGEAIGGMTDNIFEMIRRNYQRKSDEKIFVGQENKPAGPNH